MAMALTLESPLFYNNVANLKVDYPRTNYPLMMVPADKLKRSLLQHPNNGGGGPMVTFYDRITESNVLPDHGSGGRGWHVVLKVVGDRFMSGGSRSFYFVYKKYEQRIAERRSWMEAYYNSVNQAGLVAQHQVKSLLDVGIGHLFGVSSSVAGGTGRFVRARSISLNLLTGEVGYWAVDEGFEGTCNYADLWFLTDCACELDMLVVPGKFATSPTPDQLARMKERKYVLANVLEPCLHDDFGPRIVKLD